MPHHSTSNKQYLLPIGLLSLVIILLLATAVFVLTPKIQNDLAQQIQQELTKHSVPAKITLSGRDVILSGTVTDAETKQKAGSIAKKVCGIRFVENQLLTEKTENLALLTTTTDKKPELLTESKIEPNLSNDFNSEKSLEVEENNKPADQTKAPGKKKLTSSLPDQTKTTEKNKKHEIAIDKVDKKPETLASVKQPNPIQEKAEELKSKNEAKVNTKADTTESITQPPTRQGSENTATKRKTLNYETMLAAMNEYKKQKGRNPKRLKTTNLHFKKDSDEILPASHTELNKWVSHFQKNKAPIEITVTTKNETLALKQAKAIRAYFTDQGIKEDRIKVIGKNGKDTIRIEAVK